MVRWRNQGPGLGQERMKSWDHALGNSMMNCSNRRRALTQVSGKGMIRRRCQPSLTRALRAQRQRSLRRWPLSLEHAWRSTHHRPDYLDDPLGMLFSIPLYLLAQANQILVRGTLARQRILPGQQRPSPMSWRPSLPPAVAANSGHKRDRGRTSSIAPVGEGEGEGRVNGGNVRLPVGESYTPSTPGLKSTCKKYQCYYRGAVRTLVLVAKTMFSTTLDYSRHQGPALHFPTLQQILSIQR